MVPTRLLAKSCSSCLECGLSAFEELLIGVFFLLFEAGSINYHRILSLNFMKYVLLSFWLLFI
ncbi:hypothetical protein HMPREF0653_02064 [Prevotella disiens JCM 6334 = ATCC 29426]|uniref:Uncharacterized protein n=1 Tax=Prevotella disiens JCM 6334 = ATCC 29426 TaxID=1235811 RepID=A0ABN0NQ72_9BACT|nr:hypothetical protein HMPREF0653_02064 [Prevotella disiens JCM 6334 = ATCC 29426]